MEATLTETPTGLLCPSCERPMAFTEVTHSYRCHACNPIPENVPECATQKCKLPLTRLGEPWNCWICLKCNKHPAEVNKAMAEKLIEQRPHKPFKDHVSYSELDELVATKVAEIMAKQRPTYPPSPAEIQTMVAPAVGVGNPESNVHINIQVPKPETYLQKAKRLGVATHIPTGGMRKKTEIITDIENLEAGEESEEDAKTFSEKAQSPPGENDEHARGLKASDMM